MSSPETESASVLASKVAPIKHKKLGQLASTAICGNDITSSCLYVSALAIFWGGKWAPVVLLGVAAVLYLFRFVYAEVVGALPLNGGAYNALLNTTSKFRASMAACLTILSYMATAVISASEAMHYLHVLWHGLPIVAATVCVLGLFLALTVMGIGESAVVAIGIFVIHLFTLALLLFVGSLSVANHGLDILAANLATPSPGGVWLALLFGFSAAMLGVSGFESSANFVEEQEAGVFKKTLRNMWAAVTIFNPAIALLALATLPIALMKTPDYQCALLTHMGKLAGGQWLSVLISVDAVLVLSGAVLTSYVGVNGLIHRMTLDRCLPQFLLKRSSRGTTYRILTMFFLLCVSVLFITRGQVPALAGVYTISFLSVMALFGAGNILLKIKRARLPRPDRAPWPVPLLGIGAVIVGLIGNISMSPTGMIVFLQYFAPAVLVVIIMLERVFILQSLLFISRPFKRISAFLQRSVDKVREHKIVFFTRGHKVDHINKVMQYVIDNEHTKQLKVVTVVRRAEDVSVGLKEDIEVLNRAYPEIGVEFVVVIGSFSPRLIQKLSKEWSIPVNYMFIGSPEGRLDYDLADLGGVRLII